MNRLSSAGNGYLGESLRCVCDGSVYLLKGSTMRLLFFVEFFYFFINSKFQIDDNPFQKGILFRAIEDKDV